MAGPRIIFIHGLWMHASSWKPWMAFFEKEGYETMNPGWPGEGATVADCRAEPGRVANRGVREIADHYASIVAGLSSPPILIGHSFGGLLVQVLLGRGLAVAGIALDPAPMKGVWQLPWSAFRASFPVIGNPFNLKKAVSLSWAQFRYAFANAIPEKQARELFESITIPSPARPLFQAALATVAGSETKVDTGNLSRGPLLITGGEKDHIAPPVMGLASAAKYQKNLITDFKLFAGRGHSLASDAGWPEIAAYSLDWLKHNGYSAR